MVTLIDVTGKRLRRHANLADAARKVDMGIGIWIHRPEVDPDTQHGTVQLHREVQDSPRRDGRPEPWRASILEPNGVFIAHVSPGSLDHFLRQRIVHQVGRDNPEGPNCVILDSSQTDSKRLLRVIALLSVTSRA